MNIYLIGRLGDTGFAMPSARVESVVGLRELVPVPGAPRHIAGLFALRSRVLTLIDPRVLIGLPPADLAASRRAIVVDVDGHGYGLVVDHVDDACRIDGPETPLVGRLTPGWAAVANRGIAHNGRQYLVIDPATFVMADLAQAA